eukprot:gene19701-biopygen13965
METNVTSADFLEWTVQELKYYLAVRGLLQEGNKLELVARALVAFEKKTPIRKDLTELEQELKKSYSKMINDNEIPDPLQLADTVWSEDVSLWPNVDIGKLIFRP